MASKYPLVALATTLVILLCFILMNSNWTRTEDISEISKRDTETHFSDKVLKVVPEPSVSQSPLQQNNPSLIPEAWAQNVDSNVNELQVLQAPNGTSKQLYDSPQKSAPEHSHNDITGVCSISNGTHCDCSSRELSEVPKGLETCTTLLMNNNSLFSIPGGSFLNFTALRVLDLETNKISSLFNNSFEGLSQLEYLNLRENSLPMEDGTFPVGVFEPLLSLKSLNLSMNNQNPQNSSLEYPDQALSKLQNLTELYVDGLSNKVFGVGFNKMTSLRSLTLTGYTTGFCLLGNITNKTFRNLKQLETLHMESCSIEGNFIETEAFAMFGNLTTLDVDWNGALGFDDLVRVMKGWKNTILKQLDASYIIGRFAPSVHINKSQAASLPPTLEILEVRGNSIETIDSDVFDALPKSLKVLDASENRFTFGCYLKKMPNMTNLETLILNGGRVPYQMPKLYPPCPLPGHETVTHSSKYDDSVCHDDANTTMFIYLPPNMKTLSMEKAGLAYKFTELHVDPNNSLEILILDNNYFPILEGPLYGLHKLKNLSISGCSVQSINYTFFKDLTSLVHLDLSNNLFGLDIPQTGTLHLFSDLTSLRGLNISFNAIRYIKWQPYFFDGLSNLEELYLQNNMIWTFGFNISNMNKLRVLNIADAAVTTLREDIRQDIDNLLTEFSTAIEVDMSSNPIVCTCDNLDFVKWLSSSKAFAESFTRHNYSCVFSDSSKIKITDRYEHILEILHGQCVLNTRVFLITLGCTVLITAVIVALIIYRFRWRIRYLYYGAYLSIKKQKGYNAERMDEFKFDVFISYSYQDEDFIRNSLMPELGERHGLKLHIHGRDFVTGDYVSSNIVKAVKESRKTLVVLTRSLLNSTWCNYELQMANMESVSSGRHVLVFLFKESIPNKDLGMELLYHIRNNTYIAYPEPDDDEEMNRNLVRAFWDKLATDLKS